MTKQKITLVGFVTSKRALTAHVTVGEQAAHRYLTLSIPLEALAADDEFNHEYGRMIAQRLVAAWAERPEHPPLFALEHDGPTTPPFDCSDDCRGCSAPIPE